MKLELRFRLTLISLFITVISFAQSTLTAGDTAIIGFATDNPDQFVFVLLTDVESGTQINFTDRGWDSATSTFIAGEGTLTWTATSNLSAGTVIDILDLDDPFTADIGTITDDINFQLAVSGDQILVYQGTDLSPTFINAINMDSSGWSNATGSESTALPPGLTNGINAINFGEVDNGSFICPSDPTNGSQGTLLAAIINTSNWELENGPFIITTTLGGGCTISVDPACVVVSGNNMIYGSVFNDDNRNGVYDTSEGAQAGITINLYADTNANGVIDGAEAIVQTTTTNAAGEYSFSVVPTVLPNLSFSKRVNQGSDDAHQESNNTVVLDGSEIKFKISDLYAGFRFRDISIPRGSTINTATVKFLAKDSQIGFLSYDISIEAVDDANTFQAINNNISDRWDSSNLVNWHNMVNWDALTIYSTPDISSLIQSVISRTGWEANNDLALLFGYFDGPTAQRKTETYEKIPGQSSLLEINYDGFEAESFIIAIDETTLPVDNGLTTASTIPISFTAIDEVRCEKNFGFAASRAMIDFDGINDYTEMSTSIINGRSAFTVMFWMKMNGAQVSGSDEIFVLGQKGMIEFTIKNWTAIPGDQAIGFTGYKLSDGLRQSSHSKFQPEDWTHFAATYSHDGTDATVSTFKNGKGGSVMTIPTAVNSNANPFRMGIINGASFYQDFEGWLDDVRIFDGALTEDQIQRMVYQEIENNSGNVRGKVIPKDIVDISSGTTIPWTDLITYYTMANLTSGLPSQLEDDSSYNNFSTLNNITTFLDQTAPMPFETINDNKTGNWTDESMWKHGNIWDIEDLEGVANSISQSPEPWSIVKIHDNITTDKNRLGHGLFIDAGKTLTVNGDNKIENSWYLDLNGTIDLQGDSQLIQGIHSELEVSSQGNILRRQEGSSNVYWYNYWASPVGEISTTQNNTTFSIGALKDQNVNNIDFTGAFSPPLTDPVSISTHWLYSFQNGITYYDWNQLTESSTIEPGFGYTQKGTGNAGTEQQYIFEGKPNNGTILVWGDDVEGDDGITTESVQNVSFTSSLIGNPYPSALDADEFIKDNIDFDNGSVNPIIQGTILLWEQWAGNSHYLNAYEGGYGFINLTETERAYQHPDIVISDPTNPDNRGIKTPTKFIPVGQAFFVEVVNDGNIEFNNSQRVFKKESDPDGPIFFRSSESAEATSTEETAAETQILRLEFGVSSGASRSFVLGFTEDATDGYDYGMDGGLINDPPDDDMGSLLNGQQYVIQAFAPYTPGKEIDLVLHASGNYTYTLKSTEISNFPVDQDLFIKDNLTGLNYDLRSTEPYNFTSVAGSFTERFQVIFQDPAALSTEDFITDNTLIYVNQVEDKLYVKQLTDQAREVNFTNMLGQSIKTFNSINNQTLENGIDISKLSPGVYVVSIKTANNQSMEKKVIIN